MKRIGAVLLVGALSLFMIAGCGKKNEGENSSAAEKGGSLVFQIWDAGQKSGMEELAKAYMEEHPNVNIEVQASGWDEYWTKLEASAQSNTMPDIFWMHSNQMYKYADAGILADCTDIVDKDAFSEIALQNAEGSDGNLYGVPKDKDIICLAYNKEMFDEAGVAYPDEDWTWDDLTNASEQIYEKTGKYGYMAYAQDQIGYWNFVYQNGGQILNEDGTEAKFTDEATSEAIKFYVGLQQNDWCPTQNQFANTDATTLFFSEQGAMFYAGSWQLADACANYPELNGKWDVAVLPKCPNPVAGDGRASISNSVTYATAAKGKNKELAMDFLAYLGSEEGQKLQGETGVGIPAYNGMEETWANTFKENGYDIDASKVTDMFDYSVKYVNNPSRPIWEPKVEQTVLDMYAGTVSVDDGIQKMQDVVTAAIKDE